MMGLEHKVVSARTKANVTACVTSSVIIGTFNDYVISGLTGLPLFGSRVINAGITVAGSDRYGRYLDVLYKATATVGTPYWRRAHIDVFAFATFWAPFYAVTLTLVGKDARTALDASLSISVASIAYGPVVNTYIRWLRNQFGVSETGGMST